MLWEPLERLSKSQTEFNLQTTLLQYWHLAISCLPRIHVPELHDAFSKYPKALLSRSCCTCFILLHLASSCFILLHLASFNFAFKSPKCSTENPVCHYTKQMPPTSTNMDEVWWKQIASECCEYAVVVLCHHLWCRLCAMKWEASKQPCVLLQCWCTAISLVLGSVAPSSPSSPSSNTMRHRMDFCHLLSTYKFCSKARWSSPLA